MSIPTSGAVPPADDIDAGTAAVSSRMEAVRAGWHRMHPLGRAAVIVVVIIALVLLPVVNPPIITTEPGNDFQLACFDMARFALVALGLNVVVGQAGLLDMGYIGFFAVGSYVAALWTSPDSTYVHVPYLWTLPLAMVVTIFFGIVLGVPTLRLRGDYLALVTLGFGEIIRLLATIVPAMRGQVGFQRVGRPPGERSDGSPLFTNSDGLHWYWLTLVVIIITLVLLGNLERSRVGRAWIAIREDEQAAESMGVPTFAFKMWAFVAGAGLGGLAGAIFAGQVGFVNNQKFDVQTSLLFLVAVVLGGSGNKYGAILGGALVSYIPLRFTAIADYKYLIFGVMLMVLMVFRPQGLIAAKHQLLGRVRPRGRPAPAVAATDPDAQGER